MITSNQQTLILDALRARHPNRKKHSAPTKLDREFMYGAMTAINVLFPNEEPDKLSVEIPPYWVICTMSGRSVLD